MFLHAHMRKNVGLYEVLIEVFCTFQLLSMIFWRTVWREYVELYIRCSIIFMVFWFCLPLGLVEKMCSYIYCAQLFPLYSGLHTLGRDNMKLHRKVLIICRVCSLEIVQENGK